jgi:hypothetical protein
MKKLLLVSVLCSGVFAASAQSTATNFTVNDCNATSHDLFTELDAGKVIVLCWVMPCGSCSGPAGTTYNMVQNYQSSNPGRVFFYLCDDVGNTSCATLTSWANTNNMPNSTIFSNAAISMSDYGSSGMPKIVVLGGNTHEVFYNANNSVNSTLLQNAIDSALVATGVPVTGSPVTSLSVSPNPAGNSTVISYSLESASDVTIDVYNMLGEKVMTVYSGNATQGEHQQALNTEMLAKGRYIIRMRVGNIEKTAALAVEH